MNIYAVWKPDYFRQAIRLFPTDITIASFYVERVLGIPANPTKQDFGRSL
ncbi:hypothetical protein ACE1CI_16655 [Aerosakkonemataceae cyanobacterium BLCC-F50]|uniref:Uncharacterized protein n=1 Tax=Floridaenema flaviceps BLCC-F50 TaxID=3153642 RepID=A0ABV4XTY3_9CYAN